MGKQEIETKFVVSNSEGRTVLVKFA